MSTGPQGSVGSMEQDPFVTPGRGKSLSATASTFMPYSRRDVTKQRPETVAIPTALSTDVGLSRLLHIHTPGMVPAVEIEDWIHVCCTQYTSDSD